MFHIIDLLIVEWCWKYILVVSWRTVLTICLKPGNTSPNKSSLYMLIKEPFLQILSFYNRNIYIIQAVNGVGLWRRHGSRMPPRLLGMHTARVETGRTTKMCGRQESTLRIAGTSPASSSTARPTRTFESVPFSYNISAGFYGPILVRVFMWCTILLFQVILGGGRRNMMPNTTADPEYVTIMGERWDQRDLRQVIHSIY